MRARKTPISCNDYCDLLKQKGYKLLGVGSYASVFRRGREKTVIKIGHRAKTDGYFKYAEAILSGKYKSPLLPVIWSLELFKYCSKTRGWEAKNGRQYYVAKLEYLTHERLGTDYGLVGRIQSWIEYDSWNSSLAKRYPKYVPAIRLIRALAKTHNVDMHDDNYMYRGNQLVLTDPLSAAW